jgi:hypothetical protein
LFVIDTWQVFFCAKHNMYSLVHGKEKFMKETYTRSEMLAFEVTEPELMAAVNGEGKCICFPWVRICFVCF